MIACKLPFGVTDHAEAKRASTLLGPKPMEDVDAVGDLANRLLGAVESGSAPELMDLLTHIIQQPPGEPGGRAGEQLELLQGIALQMRLDLHAMLLHIYHRLEATRAYLDLVRHLAAREADAPVPISVADRAPYAGGQVIAWPGRSEYTQGDGPNDDNLPDCGATANG